MKSKTTVDRVMTPEPTTMPRDATLVEAAIAMQRNDIGDVIIIENNGTIYGLLTDRDIVVRAIAVGKNPWRTTLDEVCSKQLMTLAPEDTISDAISLMARRSVRRLPVVKDGFAVGIVSLGDLALAQDPKSPLGEISAATPNL